MLHAVKKSSIALYVDRMWKINASTEFGDRQFRSLFGCSFKVADRLFDMMPSDMHCKALLMALFFLKSYCNETLSAKFFDSTEKSFRAAVKIGVRSIYNLELIFFDDYKRQWNLDSPCVSLDGTDCWIDEHRPFDSDYGSHKFKHAGLRYEIGLALGCSRIIWWNGGVPCGANPDLQLARSSFVHELGANQRAAADKGYQDGNVHFMTPVNNPITEQMKNFNKKHKVMMARHEMVNKRMKQFDILRRWHHRDDEFHKICFGAIINITQLALEDEPLPRLEDMRDVFGNILINQ
jgi:hypothetical protein